MKQQIGILKQYLDILTQDTGWQIILEDYYNILRPFDVIAAYLSDRNWHTNPYCLKIKKEGRLINRCVALKPAMRRNTKKRGKPGWDVCYCGVAEYTIPIFIGDIHIATICAAGFYSDLSDRMMELLSRRTNVTKEEFCNLRKSALRLRDQNIEEKLCGYLLPAAELIKALAQENPLIVASDGVPAPSLKQQYVFVALEYIEKHYLENILPDDVANHCHISLSYLQHLFLDFLGEGVASVIRRKRLEQACRLLVETDRSVKNIALTCGFRNPDYFSVIFRRNYHVSPLAFKKEAEKKLQKESARQAFQ